MNLDRDLDLIAKRGTEAWKRVKKRSKNLADWWSIGEALQVLQIEAMNAAGIPEGSNEPPKGAAYSAAMGELLQKYKLDDIDKGDRSRLLKMMESRPAIEAWHRALPLSHQLKLNHPSTILRNWEKTSASPKPAGERRPTKLEKAEQTLTDYQTEVDQLKAHVAELEAARNEGPDDKRSTWIATLQNQSKEERARALYGLMLELGINLEQLGKAQRDADLKKQLDALDVSREQFDTVSTMMKGAKRRKKVKPEASPVSPAPKGPTPAQRMAARTIGHHSVPTPFDTYKVPDGRPPTNRSEDPYSDLPPVRMPEPEQDDGNTRS